MTFLDWPIFVLFAVLRFYTYYVFIALSLLTFFLLNKVFKSRPNLHLKVLISLWPFLANLVFLLFVYDKIYQPYLIFGFAVFTFVLIEILAKIKSKKIIFLILSILAVVLFPRLSGEWGMTTHPYNCQCLGVAVETGGIDTVTPMCYGIPLSCRPLQQSWPDFSGKAYAP